MATADNSGTKQEGCGVSGLLEGNVQCGVKYYNQAGELVTDDKELDHLTDGGLNPEKGVSLVYWGETELVSKEQVNKYAENYIARLKERQQGFEALLSSGYF